MQQCKDDLKSNVRFVYRLVVKTDDDYFVDLYQVKNISYTIIVKFSLMNV